MNHPHLPFRLLSGCFAAALQLTSPTAGQLTEIGAVVLTDCEDAGDCGESDGFGHALASADFDQDGFADLAVGVVAETVGATSNAGSVHVFYGSPGGLTSAGEQIFDQSVANIAGSPATGDRFGHSLAVGDFDLDGQVDDLAIGVEREMIGGQEGAGAVTILFGFDDGLHAAGSLFLHQNDLPPGSGESAEEEDRFGSALAALPGGGLAVGVPLESYFLPTEIQAGLVHIFHSSGPGSLFDSVTDREQNDFLGVCGALEGNELNDFWGSHLAVGAFDGDTLSLAVSGNAEELGGFDRAGRVTYMFGSAAGCLDQGTAGIQDSLEEVDNFGIALASGDFDGDGFDDLAVGAADEDLEASSDVDAGVVHVVFGTADGLTDVGDLLFDQDDFSDESAGDDDRLGMALAAGDFDADGRDDLAIGAPEENLGPAVDAGVVNVLYGSATGMTLAGNQTFSSDFPAGMPESANTDDRFGEELATGDFDGNGADDVAIGHPGEGVGSASGAGAVTVVYGLDESVGAFGTVHFVASGAVSFPELQGGRAVFVVRDGSAVPAAEVDHARTGGTATPGVDFAYTASAVDWNPGQLLPQAFFVTVNADTLDEENETIVLQLSNPSPGTALGTPTTLTFTINDDDEGGEISFDHPVFVVSEDAGLASIVIVREGGEASGVTVQFDTADLTATAGQDYSATSVVRNFAAGQSSSIVNVSVVDDAVGEGHETIQLTLTDPQGGATLGIFPTAVLVLLDDEFVFADDFEDGDTDAWSLTVP